MQDNDNRSKLAMPIGAALGFVAAAIVSVYVIWWAYKTWGLTGGAIAFFLVPETVGYLAYTVVAMAVGVPLLYLLPKPKPQP